MFSHVRPTGRQYLSLIKLQINGLASSSSISIACGFLVFRLELMCPLVWSSFVVHTEIIQYLLKELLCKVEDKQ
jgi:hypothetical protein